MKLRTILVLFIIYTAPIQGKKKKNITRPIQRESSSRINLALETAFIFDPKDVTYDMNLINTLRSFLDQLQDQLVNKSSYPLRQGSDFILTDFLHQLGSAILEYSDPHVKSLSVELLSAMEDYFVKGTRFHKILYDPRIKSFVINSLRDWPDREPRQLKADIRYLQTHNAYDNVFSEFVHYLDAYFDLEDAEKMNKLLLKFRPFPKTQRKLQKAVEQALNYIIFDRYDSISPANKTDLVGRIGKLAEYISTHFKDKAQINFSDFRRGMSPADIGSIGTSLGLPPRATRPASDREPVDADKQDSGEIHHNNNNTTHEREDNDIEHEFVFNNDLELTTKPAGASALAQNASLSNHTVVR